MVFTDAEDAASGSGDEFVELFDKEVHEVLFFVEVIMSNIDDVVVLGYSW